MRPDPYVGAARLGLDPELVRKLEARGLLSRLALSDAHIRSRLYAAHLAWLGAPRRSRRPRGA